MQKGQYKRIQEMGNPYRNKIGANAETDLQKREKVSQNDMLLYQNSTFVIR